MYGQIRKKMHELLKERPKQSWEAKLEEDTRALHGIDCDGTIMCASAKDTAYPDQAEQHPQPGASVQIVTAIGKRTAELDADVVKAGDPDPALAAILQLRPELQQVAFWDIKTQIIDPAIIELVRTVKRRKLEDFAAAVEQDERVGSGFCIVVMDGNMSVLPLASSLRAGYISGVRAFCVLPEEAENSKSCK
jgi:hypothetical protein